MIKTLYNNNEKGMALILTLILLMTLMFGVLSFSRIATESFKISQSGIDFRKRFNQQIGFNLIGINFIFNYPIGSSKLFSGENISLKKLRIDNTILKWHIKKDFLKKELKDVGFLANRKEKLAPGYQINSGGGKGTQTYQKVFYRLYTSGKTDKQNENELLIFRNWIQKTEPIH